MVWAWMLWSAYALGTRTALWARHLAQVEPNQDLPSTIWDLLIRGLTLPLRFCLGGAFAYGVAKFGFYVLLLGGVSRAMCGLLSGRGLPCRLSFGTGGFNAALMVVLMGWLTLPKQPHARDAGSRRAAGRRGRPLPLGLKSGPAAVVQGGARPSYLYTGWRQERRQFFRCIIGPPFLPGPSRTPSRDRSKIRTRSNSESPQHGWIFDTFFGVPKNPQNLHHEHGPF